MVRSTAYWQAQNKGCSKSVSFIGLSVKIRCQNKSACSKFHLVQSSRSDLTTCPRKGSLLRFQLKSTATPDEASMLPHHHEGALKLRNYFWQEFELIATKVLKFQELLQMKSNNRKRCGVCQSVETCVDWTSFNFRLK